MRRFSMTAAMIIVAAMSSFTAPPARAADGVVLATGANSEGELGNGTFTSSSTPVPVSGLSGVVTVAAGDAHNLAILGNGTVKAWGHGFYGQLGNGGTTNLSTPVSVSGLSGVVAVAGGKDYSLAVLSDGTVKAWGRNTHGQLGNGTTTNSSTPVSVSGLSGAVAVSAGVDYSMALLSNGTVKTWGLNDSGQLGNGTGGGRSLTPVSVSSLSGVVAVVAGNYHGLALLSDGTVKAWGGGYAGQLGNGTMTGSSTPVSVSGLSDVVAISAGDNDSLALLSDGTVKAWGDNDIGQLGNGNTTDSSTPVSVSGLSGVVAVAAGNFYNLALMSDGTVKAWGRNSHGEFGNGTTTNSLTPVSVSGLSGVTAVAAGNAHSLFLGLGVPTVVSTSNECHVQTIVVVFSTYVSNVTPDDLQISPGSVTGVSGSGNTYTFTISGASGTVTATLDGDITNIFGDDLAPYEWSFSIEADTDGDGWADTCDDCPNDPNKSAPGQCGCGTPDTDSDGDGTANCIDGCPNDPNKIAPGQCGCGTPDTDNDGDGALNCLDGCPFDTYKIAPGVCGCGTPDTDSDGDGTIDCLDGCPNDPNKIAPGQCGCGFSDGGGDSDGDGTPDCFDACPNDPNKIAPGVCGCGVAETCPIRTITQWRSVRSHNSSSPVELSIVLNATATGNGTNGPTVETRGLSTIPGNFGIQGIKKIQVDFNGPMTLVNGSNVTVTYRLTTPGFPATMGGPIGTTPISVAMADADTLNILFADLQIPNMSCVNIVVGAGTFSEAITGDTDCNIRSLTGDTNGNGTVTVTDMMLTKSKISQPAASNVRFDVNVSNTITLADLLAVKVNAGSPSKTALCP